MYSVGAPAVLRQPSAPKSNTREKLKRDREVVLEAVKQDGYALRFASEELRGDRDVVMEAVKQNGDALQYASQELQRDTEVR